MPAKKLWIVKHKVLATGIGAGGGYLWWHHKQTGSWLPSSMTGVSPTGQGYMPGQTAGQYYPPSGMPYGGGAGGSNYPYPDPNAGLWAFLEWWLRHRGKKRDKDKKPKPKAKVPPWGRPWRLPEGWEPKRTKRHGHGDHDNRRFKSGGVPMYRSRHRNHLPKGKYVDPGYGRLKFNYTRPGPVTQRPVAHFRRADREGHVPAPRPSAPPPRTTRTPKVRTSPKRGR